MKVKYTNRVNENIIHILMYKFNVLLNKFLKFYFSRNLFQKENILFYKSPFIYNKNIKNNIKYSFKILFKILEKKNYCNITYYNYLLFKISEKIKLLSNNYLQLLINNFKITILKIRINTNFTLFLLIKYFLVSCSSLNTLLKILSNKFVQFSFGQNLKI